MVTSRSVLFQTAAVPQPIKTHILTAQGTRHNLQLQTHFVFSTLVYENGPLYGIK